MTTYRLAHNSSQHRLATTTIRHDYIPLRRSLARPHTAHPCTEQSNLNYSQQAPHGHRATAITSSATLPMRLTEPPLLHLHYTAPRPSCNHWRPPHHQVRRQPIPLLLTQLTPPLPQLGNSDNLPDPQQRSTSPHAGQMWEETVGEGPRGLPVAGDVSVQHAG